MDWSRGCASETVSPSYTEFLEIPCRGRIILNQAYLGTASLASCARFNGDGLQNQDVVLNLNQDAQFNYLLDGHLNSGAGLFRPNGRVPPILFDPMLLHLPTPHSLVPQLTFT